MNVDSTCILVYLGIQPLEEKPRDREQVEAPEVRSLRGSSDGDE